MHCALCIEKSHGRFIATVAFLSDLFSVSLSLKLGVSNSWLNARPLTLDGGAIAGATNTANAVGALTVGANGGAVELDPGATLSFADSSEKTWPGSLLTIKGWREKAVKFGDSPEALDKEQLDLIRAEKPGGKKMRLGIDPIGYLVRRGIMVCVR